MGLPTHVRVLALLGAAIVGLVLLGPALANLTGSPIASAGKLLVGLPLFAALAWVAAWPDHADRTLRQRWGVDLADNGTLAAVAVHLVFAGLVFGLTLVTAAQDLAMLIEEGRHPAEAGGLTSGSILFALGLNVVLFAVAAVTWLTLADKTPLDAVPEALRMTGEDLPRALVGGVLAAVAGVVLLGALGIGLQQIGFEPSNPQAQAIADALTWETALVVAALAALGEEVYFRGFLLPRTGNVTQAVLFGIVHAAYLTPLQVVLPILLGLGFGWLTRKTNLWGAIFAHFLFNAIMLVGAIYGGEFAQVAGL